MCKTCLDSIIYYHENRKDIFDIFKAHHEDRNENPHDFEEQENKNTSIKTLDIFITSASRPKALEVTVKSMQHFLKFSGGLRFFVHEDAVPGKEKGHKELIKWVRESKIFTEVLVSNPRVGRGMALNKLKSFMKNKYFMYSEEDLAFTGYVNVDKYLNMMDKFQHINQVCFPYKFPSFVEKPSPDNPNKKFNYTPKQYNGIDLCVADRFGWFPGFWRKDFVFKNWYFEKYRSNKGFNKNLKKRLTNEWDYDSIEKVMGVYYAGSPGNDTLFLGSKIFHLGKEMENDRMFL